MSRVHDMGGRFGDGPIESGDAPIIEKDWHARVLAVTLACGSLGQWNIDMSRRSRENLSPQDYTCFSYYEKWMGGLAAMLVEQGVVTREELSSGAGQGISPLAERALQAQNVATVLAKGASAERPAEVAPLFKVGDHVRTRMSANQLIDGGHTRLPRYAAKAKGRILRLHGHHVLPDSSAHGLGDAPEPLYAVAFSGWELWQNPEHPKDEVVLDLWQSYLEPS